MTVRDYWLQIRRRPRLFAVVCFFLTTWLVIDFATRVWVSRDLSLRSFAPKPVATIPRSPQVSAVKSAISEWFPIVAAADQAPPPREMVPQGIFRSEGQSVAIVLLKANETQPDERRRLVVGDLVDGFTVESIDIRRIVLTKDGQTRELVLLRGKP